MVEPTWVTRSNQYTQMLLDVQTDHSPESGSALGLARFDSSITNASRAEEIAQRQQLQAVLAKLKKVEAKEKNRDVREDLEIIQKAYALRFREDDYQLDHKVQFIDASQAVYLGLRTLLDDQVAAERRPAAVVRLRKYAGVEPGFEPFSNVLKQRMIEQMAKQGVVYPSTARMEAALTHDKTYIDDMRALFVKYKMTGWEGPFAKLQQELADYNTWIRATVMPRARNVSHLSPEEYALSLENYGIDLPPAQLATQTHQAFTQDQAEMAPLAAQVAKQHGWNLTDYRDVVRELKKTQIVGDAILPFYQTRLKTVEDILVAKDLVTLPGRAAVIRLATAAETAQQPAPHMVPPPFLHNTGQTGEFLLPLNTPSTTDDTADRYDDFTYDAASWSIVAHELRPGDELLFDSMLLHGVSKARWLYTFNSTNVEAWGYYSEWVLQPYEPVEGQLVTLQLRLLCDARAFLESELQSGKITANDAEKVLENDVVLSPAFAGKEVARLSYLSPGETESYFNSYTKMLQLRKDTENALGPNFDARKFHDFVLAQGLLPPDLLRQAVMQDFVPAQKKKSRHTPR